MPQARRSSRSSAARSTSSTTTPNRSPGSVERNHLTLLAASDDGYRNLVKLSSEGFLEGLHRGKPTLDMAQLAAHGEGIIALTGCLASRFCQRLVDGRDDEARAHADDLMNAFGAENVYFEVQKNGIADQDKANEGIVRIAREVGRPLVGTGDVHYLRREDYHHHTALLCVQTKSTLAAPKMTFDTNEFFLRSNEEMAQAFAEWPEAIASTLEIAERCDVEIELGRQLIPRYLPEGEDERAYLRERVMEGLRARYGDPVPAEAIERAEMELGVIDRMGFNAYFLIVWDFVKWAKDNGIAVGPGPRQRRRLDRRLLPAHHRRRPAALRPALRALPEPRARVDAGYRHRLLGARARARHAVRDREVRPRVGRADHHLRQDVPARGHPRRRARARPRLRRRRPPGQADPRPRAGPPADLRATACARASRCAAPTTPTPTAKQIVDVARGLEGIVRNASIHAAAVVIAGTPLTDIVPLQLADAGGGNGNGNGERDYRLVTQFSMKPVEELGLLKMDFLGLRNLDVIEDALDIIERSSGQRPDMTSLPLDDAKTYEMMARGDSVGVFQFESEGMQSALRQVKPTEFDDLVALVALYRPGAMDQIPAYARGKRNPDAVTVPDERLEPIIGSTYGVILYQEQAMQISKALAGFSGAKADDLRKAIGKKNREAMAELEPEFREGCRASGTRADVIDWLWTTNERSADYSFNKPPRRLLRADRLPHGVAEGQPPRRVHGRADLLGHGHQGQGPVLRRPGRGHGDRHPAARRQRLRPRVRGRRRQHPLRPGRGEGRRLRRRRGDQVRARGGRRVPVAVGLLHARRSAGGQQARDRGAHQVRRLRLDQRLAQGHARRARAGAGGGPAGPARRADRPGVDLRPGRRSAAATAARRRRSWRRSTRRSRPRSSSRPSCWPSRRRPSGSSSPRTRSRRCARRCAPPSTPRWPRCPTARTATGSPPGGSSPRPRRSAPRRATR